MIYSMTGFGKCALEENGRIVEIEVKSLNSRYLDLSVRMPKDFYSKELEIREIVRKKVKRGKVSVFINFSRSAESFENFNLDENAVVYVAELLKKISSLSGIKKDISMRDLLEFQSMFLTEGMNGDNSEFPLIKKALDKALNEMIGMRKSEGASLKTELEKRLNIIEQNVVQIEKISKNSVKEYFETLVDRAEQLFANMKNNEERLYTELALLTEKMDLTEECVRLKSHLEMFGSTLIENSEAGRRLNFIVQEMNREVNTINSKTVSKEISQMGIVIKEEIEKIREQIQNIE